MIGFLRGGQPPDLGRKIAKSLSVSPPSPERCSGWAMFVFVTSPDLPPNRKT